MPINISETKKKLTENIISIPIIDTIIKNPLFTALTIVIIILFIILLVFRDVEVNEDTSLFKLSTKVSIYSFIIVAGLIFLNNYYIEKEIISKTKSGAMEELFNDIDMVGSSISTESDSFVPVSPTSSILKPVTITLP